MKGKYIALLIGTPLVLVAVYLIWPEWFGLCEARMTNDGPICRSPFGYPYGVSLLPLASVFLGASIVMLFAKRKTFSRWIKFSIGYAIVITGLLFAVPEIGYGVGGFGFTLLDTQGFAILYSALYALISLVLFSTSEFLERRHNKIV